MSRRNSKLWGQAGLPPGIFVYAGEKHVEQARTTLIDYGETHFQEEALALIPHVAYIQSLSGDD